MNPKSDDKKLISVVTPCFNEQENVEKCYETTLRTFQSALSDYDFEQIFCDNASSDETVAILRRLANQDRRVKVILNARNFGPIHSNFNGVMASRGDAVVVCLPADLQDPPELIPEFVARWREGNQVVWGIRKQREEGWLMRIARKVYYRLAARLANVDTPVDGGLFQLVDRRVLDAIKDCDDFYPYIPGLVAHCGFQSTQVEYTWRRRERSVSKATLFDMAGQASNAFTSFSRVPLRVCFFLGVLMIAASLLTAIFGWVAHAAISGNAWPPGLATLAVGTVFLSGVQMLFMGILGEYIGSIHFQVRRRPLVVETERINFDSNAPSEEEPIHGRAA